MLKQIHDDLDAAVAPAYGWPVDLSDEQILQKLVALNAERAEDEKRGIIRWLRPEFQNPGGASTTQQTPGLETAVETKPAKGNGAKGKSPCPKDLISQISVVRQQLATATGPMKAAEVAKAFKSAKLEKVTDDRVVSRAGSAGPGEEGGWGSICGVRLLTTNAKGNGTITVR